MKVPSEHPPSHRSPPNPPAGTGPAKPMERRRPATLPATPRSLLDALRRGKPDPDHP